MIFLVGYIMEYYNTFLSFFPDFVKNKISFDNLITYIF